MASSSSTQQAIAQWRPRQYVLAGMSVILAVSTVTIVTSIILQPTDIYFSIANFSMNQTNSGYMVEDNSVVVAFNLTARNPSDRAGVVYRYIVVSMQLKNNGSPSVRKASVPALLTDEDSKQIHQGRNSNRTIGVEAILDRQFFSFYDSKPSATITIFAQAQFKVGLASSRVYNIRVGCEPIYLASVNKKSGIIANCSSVN